MLGIQDSLASSLSLALWPDGVFNSGDQQLGGNTVITGDGWHKTDDNRFVNSAKGP